MFYDPETHVIGINNYNLAEWCDPNGDGEVPLDIQEVSPPGQDGSDYVISGDNVPFYLYRVNTPPDFSDYYAGCGAGDVVTPAFGTGTVSVKYSSQSASARWEETASGTYVDAATGQTCRLNAHGGGHYSNDPYYFDLTSNINTNGC